MTIIRNLIHIYTRRRFACLFFSLLITMTAAPVLSAMGLPTRFIWGFLTLNLVMAILITFSGFALGSYLGTGLLILALAATCGHAFLGSTSLLITSQGIGVLICLLSVVIMFRHILEEGEVTSERIFAALNVYLMIGIVCGLLFGIIEEEWPGSFSVQGSSLAGDKRVHLTHTIYFSFVTLGTLGYGDMIPVSGPARALAVVEALGGQIYLVVIVARLVSLYRGPSERRKKKRQEKPVMGGKAPSPP